MAVQAWTNVSIIEGALEIGGYVKNFTGEAECTPLDTTDFASGGWVEMIGGLKSGQLSIEFMDDLADSSIDDDLWQIFGTVVTFTVKGTSASVGVNNPSYSGSVLITGTSLGGSVGDLAGKTLTFPTSGAISRAES